MRSTTSLNRLTLTRYRVLVVDDSAVGLELLSRCLSQSPLHEFVVTTASSMQDGLDSLVTLRPDCIILDYILGGTTGLQFIEEVRARGDATPIVIVTAMHNRIAARLIRAGAYDFINKTEIREHLAGVVISAIQDSGAEPHRELGRSGEAADLRAAVERASYLSMVSKRLTAVDKPDLLVDTILELALMLFGDVAFIDFVEQRNLTERQLRFSAQAGYPLHGDTIWTPPAADADDGVRNVMRLGQPRYYDRDQLAAIGQADANIGYFRRHGLATLAIVPLSSNTTIFGTLSIGSADQIDIRYDRRAVLEEFAQRAGLAIENARNVKATRAALEIANAARKRLNFQAQVSSLLVHSLDWRDTLQSLTRKLTSFLCEGAAIHLDNGQDHVFHCSSRATGIPANAPEPDSHSGNKRIRVPLGGPGRIFGTLSLFAYSGAAVFSLDDQTLAEDLGRRLTAYLDNAWTFERERNIAVTLQNSLLLKTLPQIPGLEIAGRYLAGAPGMEVGGDWYDVIPISDERVVFALGDVAGRGVLAAAVMGQLRNVLRAYALEGHSPAGALERVNTIMKTMPDETFATIVYVILDKQAHTITYACAGHPPPLIARADGKVEVLTSGRSCPVGVLEDFHVVEETTALAPGSTLLLYTDGLVESKDRGADEGVQKLFETLTRSARTPEIVAGVLLEEMVTNRNDDVALLSVRLSDGNDIYRRTWSAASLDRRTASSLRIEITRFLTAHALSENTLYDSSVIVGELLGNVARYAPGRMEIEIDWTDEYPILHIKDYGKGMSGDVSITQAKDVEGTNGRGLFLISHLGRNFIFRTQAGEGTYARVTLPVRRII